MPSSDGTQRWMPARVVRCSLRARSVPRRPAHGCGLRVPAGEISGARRELSARVLELPAGHWEVPRGEGARGRLGYLILDGLLARDMTLAGRTATELLGDGDVVQPWVASREEGLVRYGSPGTS